MLETRGRIDDWAVERLVRIVASATASEEVRCRAAGALALAIPDTREGAIAFLVRRLTQGLDLLASPSLGLALARSLLALDRVKAIPVLERVARENPALRAEIGEMLHAPS
jgi:hypothetical protein